jgi:hypothetical protein
MRQFSNGLLVGGLIANLAWLLALNWGPLNP